MTLNDSIRFFTEESHIMPGLSVACGTAEKVLTAHGGLADEDAGTPLTADSIFDLASLTKLFTALLVMRLREEGRLELDKPVTTVAEWVAHILNKQPHTLIVPEGRFDGDPTVEPLLPSYWLNEQEEFVQLPMDWLK